MNTIFDEWRGRSPFYDESHEAVASSVRKFVEREVEPHIARWEGAGTVPSEVIRSAGAQGILGFGYPEQYGGQSDGIDIFHRYTVTEELSRPGYGGFPTALLTHTASMPLLLAAGSEEMKERLIPSILKGEKQCSIAMTEASGGSDVAHIKTTAKRVGDRYVINGSKLYISHGMSADYHFVACRTGGEGVEGLSVIMIEKGTPGFSQTPLEKMGWHICDTASLYFDQVEVPIANRLGPENGGFGSLMRNLDGERLYAAFHCCANARVCIDEAIGWARERVTFGKRLADHQVIRTRIAEMIRAHDAAQSMVDLCAWRAREGRMNRTDSALVKVEASRMFERVVREACHILGGLSFIKGSKVERLYREVLIEQIGGGAESILLDLAGRLACK